MYVQISLIVRKRSLCGRGPRLVCWRLFSRVRGFSWVRRTRRLISFIFEVAMVVILVLLLIMVISWMVSRVSAVFMSTFTRLPWCTLPKSSRRSWVGLRGSGVKVLVDRWEILIINLLLIFKFSLSCILRFVLR